jgi:hypothetical protein
VFSPIKSPTLRVADADDAVDRRSHLRPVEVELRVLDGGARRVDGSSTRAARLHRVVELLTADRTFGGERRVAFHVLLSLGQVRLGVCKVALRLRESRFVRARVDLEQQVVRVHERAFGVVAGL